MKKLASFLILTLLFSFSTISFATSEDDEIIDIVSLYDETISTSSKLDSSPNIFSRYGIVYERNSKSILFEKNKDTKTPMASTTKIMTAIVVIENANLSETVTVSQKAAGTGGSRLGLSKDSTITIHDLLYGLMLCSGNDCAVCLAETVGGSVEEFAKLMNDKAKQLNLFNTNFVTPHGLDNENHYTTAYELAILADYALQNDTFSKIVGTKTYTITINGYPKTISNTNELLGSISGVYGVKTGFTNGANRCLVSATKRGSLDIICVVLGADTKKIRTQDSIKLIEYCFNKFETINIGNQINNYYSNWLSHNLNNIHIIKGNIQKLNIYLEIPKNTFVTLNKNDIDKINYKIDYKNTYEAPLSKDSVFGTLSVFKENDLLLSANIKNADKIERKSILDYLLDFSKNYILFLTSKSIDNTA